MNEKEILTNILEKFSVSSVEFANLAEFYVTGGWIQLYFDNDGKITDIVAMGD